MSDPWDDWSDFQAEWREHMINEFCDHADKHPLDPLPEHPYSEDGYCCWCGNGSWKFHAPWCEWADVRDGLLP
jgi:hypothetical protein